MDGTALAFSVPLELFGHHLHPHPVFESLAYVTAFAVYRHARRRRGDPLGDRARLSVLVAAAIGALIGSKLLNLLVDPAASWAHRAELMTWLGGKTMVGGLLGGVIGVELYKKRRGIRVRTGDLYAVPLLVGIAVGRIGCFLTGLDDLTYGRATSLPWGIDFGDGIRRHPTQLYEIGAMVLLAGYVAFRARRPHAEGDLFRLALLGYLAWRLLVDFIKPGPRFFGLGAIQWACLAGLLVYAREIPRLMARSQGVPHEPA
ncbi:MAG: prolipoprotein diacylglyceryl transferase [Planctomycetota bacterium]